MKFIYTLLFSFCFFHSNSQVLWQKAYDITCHTSFIDAIPAGDEGYIIVGDMWCGGTGVLVTKVDLEGNMIWSKIHSVGDNSSSLNHHRIFEYNNGEHFILLGESYELQNDDSYSDIFWMLLDSEGEVVSINSHPGDSLSQGDVLLGAEKLPSGDIIYAQGTYNSQDDSRKLFIRKINPEAELVESIELDYPDTIYFRSMTVSSDEDVFITGHSDSFIFASKISQTGSIEWINPYGPTEGINYGYNIIERQDGNFEIIGKSSGFDVFPGFYIIQIDTDGEPINSCTFQYWSGIFAPSPQIDATQFGDGTLILERDMASSPLDFQLHRIGNDCTLIGTETFFFEGDEYVRRIKKVGENKVMMLGSAYEDKHQAYAILLNDSLITNTAEQVANDDFKLNIYPNPFAQKIEIEIAPELIGAKIKIRNLNSKIVHQYQPQSTSELIDLTHIPPGVYFLEIENSKDGQRRTYKVMKSKTE